MNSTRQPFANKGQRNAAPKKFNLSLKKSKTIERKLESAKENNPSEANKNIDVYDYRNVGQCISDNSSNDSQNYSLRLSDSISNSANDKKVPCYYKSNESKWTKGNNIGTVVINDTTCSSSNDNSPHLNKDKKLYTYTPFCQSEEKNSYKAIDVIVLDSSDSDIGGISESNKQSESLISLDSDDDSVLNTLQNNYHKSIIKNQKKGTPDMSNINNHMYVTTNNLLFSSGQVDTSKMGFLTKSLVQNRHNKSMNSTTGSSSTHFSPDTNIPQVMHSSPSSKYEIISESSSSHNDSAMSLIKDPRDQKRRTKTKFSVNRTKSQYNTTTSDDNMTESVQETNFGNVSSRFDSKSGITMKPYDSVKLTKKDVQKIFTGVKASTNRLWNPKLCSPYLKHLSDSLSSYPQDKDEDVKNRDLINETESELVRSESCSDNEVRKSLENIKPTKTHVIRFMNTPNTEEQQFVGLSERKKNEISKWLMNNTPESSSPSSIISESNRNSSSGNSSLERFELEHETPNNRGKISKPGTSENINSVPRTLDRFIYKGKTSVLKNQTPSKVCNPEKKKLYATETVTPKPLPEPIKEMTKKNLPIVTAVENLHIEDCADILDKLYGNVWRNKADAVLTPQTEPRPQKNITKKKQSKTERKQRSKPISSNKKILSSSEEDEFDKFIKDIKPNFNSTKKKLTRHSFINDKSTSGSSSESFYYTALTNPRESKENPHPKPAPVSASIVKAIAICDSDSDTNDNYHPISDRGLNKKRLSFSEDTSDSDTSEFDPGEPVPPKPKANKASIRKHQQEMLKSIKEQTVPKHCNKISNEKKTRSFLASLSATVPIHSCHPTAKVYRENYKNKKDDLCKYLFKLYNKEIFDGKLPADMPIEWNVRMRGTAGFCYNKKSVKALGGITRSSRIVLATKILDTPDRLRDTLVHEMCHAAAWLINNVSDGHGPYWKGWASKAIKTFPELPPIKRCHDYKIKTKFTYRCTKCGYSIGRHSKSLDVERKRCGHCYGKFELLINRTTRSGTMQVATPAQTRTPSGFALYVKENYHSVKNNRRSIKHAEIMKILGQQFSAVKIGKKTINDVQT